MKKIILLSILLLFYGLTSVYTQHCINWEKQIIYFILIDRFHNGDIKNDLNSDKSSLYAYHGGDIQGIIEKLPYLQKMGVTALWLSPVFDNRDENFFKYSAYHGYWVKDFYNIDEHIGNLQLLKKLSKELKKRGMYLILDMVVNHVDYDSPMLKKYPDWFHKYGDVTKWYDQFQLLNYRVHGLPDLAQENPEVSKFLINNAKWWIDQVQPDGFRLDAVKHVPLDFWKNYNLSLKKYAGNNFLLLGELLDGNSMNCAYTLNKGKFNSLFDFPLHYVMKRIIADETTAQELGVLFYQDKKYPNPNMLVTLLDNHDLDRFFTSLNNNKERFKLALSLLFALRGIPSIYYGTEAGLKGHIKDITNRRDMIFNPEHDFYKYIQKLAKLRADSTALTLGKQIHLFQTSKIYSFARISKDELAIIVFNNNRTKKKINFPLSILSDHIKVNKVIDTTKKYQAVIKDDKFYLDIPKKSCLIFFIKSNFKKLLAQYEKYQKYPKKVTVKFKLKLPGNRQKVYVIGGDKNLGNWDISKALGPMKYIGNGHYEIETKLNQASVLCYKHVIQGEKEKNWELGLQNRFLEVPWKGKLEVSAKWNKLD